MIKKLAWDTFKNTGNINTFLELVEFENAEKNLLVDSNRNMKQNILDNTQKFAKQPNIIFSQNINNSIDEVQKLTD